MNSTESENVLRLGYYLGASPRKGTPLINGYVTTRDAKDKLAATRTTTSGYGRLVENAALDLWTGAKQPPLTEAARNLFFATLVKRKIVAKYKFFKPEIGKKTAEHNLTEVYNSVYGSHALRGLLISTCRIFDVDLSMDYKQLPWVAGEVGSGIIHLVNALLVFAKLANYPRPPIPGVYHRNIPVPNKGVPSVKFDALITPSSRREWKYDFDPLAKRIPPFVPLEIKTALRGREAILDVTNPYRNFSPQAYQNDQVYHQLGALMLERQTKWGDGYLLPLLSYTLLVHMRAAAPQWISKVDLSSQAINKWADNLLENLAMPKLQQYPTVLERMDRLESLLRKYAEAQDQNESVRMRVKEKENIPF